MTDVLIHEKSLREDIFVCSVLIILHQFVVSLNMNLYNWIFPVLQFRKVLSRMLKFVILSVLLWKPVHRQNCMQ